MLGKKIQQTTFGMILIIIPGNRLGQNLHENEGKKGRGRGGWGGGGGGGEIIPHHLNLSREC